VTPHNSSERRADVANWCKGIERPSCTICRTIDAKPYPQGSFHLNLAPPLGVMRCQRCGLSFLSPRPDASLRSALFAGEIPEVLKPYGAQVAHYSAVTETRADVFRERLRVLSDLATRSIAGRRPKLLDVGASSGVLVQQARARGWDAEGIEPSVEGRREARNRQIELLDSAAESLPFSAATFDVVHAHHVFEHLADPLRAAGEARRVLRPGGLLFVEVPNQLDNVSFRRDICFRRVHQRERNMRSIHHLWFFSRRTLRGLFAAAKFQSLGTEDVYGAPAYGWKASLSFLTRGMGKIAFGGPIVRAWGYKPEE